MTLTPLFFNKGIFFSKDRREEVIEVEEEPETILDSESNERVKLMTQGEWMKGCPEGSEQSFLFGLYSELSQGKCTCPNCGKHLVVRRKRDFFTLYVRRTPLYWGHFAHACMISIARVFDVRPAAGQSRRARVPTVQEGVLPRVWRARQC